MKAKKDVRIPKPKIGSSNLSGATESRVKGSIGRARKSVAQRDVSGTALGAALAGVGLPKRRVAEYIRIIDAIALEIDVVRQRAIGVVVNAAMAEGAR